MSLKYVIIPFLLGEISTSVKPYKIHNILKKKPSMFERSIVFCLSVKSCGRLPDCRVLSPPELALEVIWWNVAFCLLLLDLLLQEKTEKKGWHWPNNKIYALAKTLICLKPLRVHLSGKSLQLDGWVVILAPASHQSTPYLPGFVPPNLSPFTFVTLKLPTPQNTHFRSPWNWRNDFILSQLKWKLALYLSTSIGTSIPNNLPA